MRPSVQGGVVRDPEYLCIDCSVRVDTKDVKSSAPVSVTEPGLETAPMFSITDVRIEVVSPDPLSWKGTAMTTTDSSVSR